MSTVLGCCSSPNFNRECFNTLIFASIARSRNTLLQAAKRLRCTYSGCPIQDQERRWISDTFIHVCTTQNNWVSFIVSIHTARLSTSTWMPRTAPEACGRRRLPIIDQVMLRVDFSCCPRTQSQNASLPASRRVRPNFRLLFPCANIEDRLIIVLTNWDRMPTGCIISNARTSSARFNVIGAACHTLEITNKGSVRL